MAALVEEMQYGLSSLKNSSQNKTIVLVKLTDSSSRIIHEFLKSKPQRPPSIQFHGNQGLLLFQGFTSADKQQHTFGFSLSAVEVDGPQGSFECLHQAGQKNLHSFGGIQYKMQIHASEDSYEKTRVKMAVVEQESKKNCTKVLKSAGPYIGRKVKVKRPTNAIIPPKSLNSSPLSYMSSGGNKLSVPPPTSKTPPPPTLHSNAQKSFSSNTCKANQEITTKNIRDRIVHLLALSPYKIPEIKAKLFNEGVKDAEKKSLMTILKSIATSKDGVYYLSRNSWNLVQETWPFYTPEERDIVKRKKTLNLAPSQQDVDSNSPNYHSNPSPGQKRQALNLNDQANKKQKFSHFNNNAQKVETSKPPSDSMKLPLNGRTNGLSPHESSIKLENKRPVGQHHNDPPPDPPYKNGLHKHMNGFDRKFSSLDIASSRPNGSLTSPDTSPESSRDSLESEVNHVSYDFIRKYVEIANGEQRTQYKADFNAEYAEYRSLHSQIDAISKKFAALDHSLHATQEGTDEYYRIQQEILREYEESKHKLKYDQIVARFRYLHDKLAHIKRLVLDFDRSQSIS